MPFQTYIAAGGVAPLAARAIVGGTITGLTATGSAQTDALALSVSNNFVATTAASTGVILPTAMAGDRVFIYNGGASTLSVYPPTGGAINNIAANGAFSVATLKSCIAICKDSTSWAVMLGA